MPIYVCEKKGATSVREGEVPALHSSKFSELAKLESCLGVAYFVGQHFRALSRRNDINSSFIREDFS